MSNNRFAPPEKMNQPAPNVVFPPIKIQQPDGSILIKPGKPVVLGKEMRCTEFAKHTGLSSSRVHALCAEGKIASRRMTTSRKSPYLIPRSELDRYLNIDKIERS
jgi:hypothetical protein